MINVSTSQLDEILQVINDSDDPLGALKNTINNSSVPYIREYLELMVSDKWPNADVDQIVWKSIGLHRSEVGAYLLNRSTANTFKEVLFNDKVKLHTQQYHLKSILEMLYEGEAKILIALLKKNLTELYPNITFEIIIAAL